MKPETLEHFQTALDHGRKIISFTSGMSFEDYSCDDKTRLAVERSFEIIGEAFNRVRKDESEVLEAVSDHRQIISFRNILAHGYDHIEDKIVWGVVIEALPKLLVEVEAVIQKSPDCEAL